jgi:very-short-patch-repair endonuclease
MGTFTKPGSEFVAIPMVQAQIVAAARLVGTFSAAYFHDEMDGRLDSNELAFDSPLEVAFWVWWRACQKLDHFCGHNMRLCQHVEAQTVGARYVIDFVVTPVVGSSAGYVDEAWPLIGIELDGHAFHETTPEQATYRNQRDRALQQAGWRMFHFSFAEFTTQPETCIWEVVEFARATYWRIIGDHVKHRAEAAAHNKDAAPVGDDAP